MEKELKNAFYVKPENLNEMTRKKVYEKPRLEEHEPLEKSTAYTYTTYTITYYYESLF